MTSTEFNQIESIQAKLRVLKMAGRIYDYGKNKPDKVAMYEVRGFFVEVYYQRGEITRIEALVEKEQSVWQDLLDLVRYLIPKKKAGSL